MLRVDKVELKNALDFVKCAVSKDEFRPVLTGIHLYLKDGRLVVEAVDGFRIMQTSVEVIESDVESFDCLFDYNVPIKATKREINGIDIHQPDAESVDFADVMTRQKISYRIIEGEPMKTDQIWPDKEPEYEIVLNPKYVMELAKAYKDDNAIKFKFYGNLRPVVVVPEAKNPKPSKALVLPLRK